LKISNQFLAIPPDHPSAIPLFDLIGLQKVCMDQIDSELAAAVTGGDNTLYDQTVLALDVVNKKIEAILKKYRIERGGDETCRVGLTYDARGYPIVTGRPCGPMLH
jgi:hypothetical protein